MADMMVKSSMKDNIFTFLQRLSQSFMLPIALMPIAGFYWLLGLHLLIV